MDKRTFFRILAITASIDLLGYLLGRPLARITTDALSPAAWAFGAAMLLSTVADVLLACRWGRTPRERRLLILLMPTNYLFPLIILARGLRLFGMLQGLAAMA